MFEKNEFASKIVLLLSFFRRDLSKQIRQNDAVERLMGFPVRVYDEDCGVAFGGLCGVCARVDPVWMAASAEKPRP